MMWYSFELPPRVYLIEASDSTRARSLMNEQPFGLFQMNPSRVTSDFSYFKTLYKFDADLSLMSRKNWAHYDSAKSEWSSIDVIFGMLTTSSISSTLKTRCNICRGDV